jgi:DNA-binding transcriptional ArsR family regulator
MSGMRHPSRDRIRLVDVFAALGHPVRARIVRAVAPGEETFCGVAEHYWQSTTGRARLKAPPVRTLVTGE